ncbi:MAG TPA: carbon-nitrogen hydrolase family protein [Candidatus Limnocylindrales bacterium]|nr:carbon-nitrogen hydrolase family protein [Candidatus Limnocylindrales bacterium]
MSDAYQTIRLAAAQVAPVFLDREATIVRACEVISEAGAKGADLVAFPEGYVPAHPLWFHFHPATSRAARAMSVALANNAVVVPSPATDALCEVARSANCSVVIGICEKAAGSAAALYNSLLIIGRDGRILGCRRKIVPTNGERIVHTPGAGDSIQVFPTEFGVVAGLMCGENSNPLLTYTMQALGAQVHVASWPSFPHQAADLQAIADVAGRAVAYQNSCFVVNVLGAVSETMIERLPATEEDAAYLRRAAERGGTTIYAPGGRVLEGPLPGGEGILYADADLGQIVPRKLSHDYAGNYNRFDIFQLVVNASPAMPALQTGLPTSSGLLVTTAPFGQATVRTIGAATTPAGLPAPAPGADPEAADDQA